MTDMDAPPRSQSDVDDILRKKRKIREHKACYPCRQRKVRCDSQVPCKTCRERNHPELCTFNPPEKRVDNGSTHSSVDRFDSSVAVSRDDWDRLCAKLSIVERTLLDFKDVLRKVVVGPDSPHESAAGSKSPVLKEEESQANGPRYVRNMEINEQSNLSGELVHLGGGSVPALVKALGRDRPNRPAVQEVVEHSVLSLFGLDNESATYPFVSLWGGPQAATTRVSEIGKTLPSDSECLDFFRHYRDGAAITYPAIVEIDQFESDLVRFLMQRNTYRSTNQQNDRADSVFGMNLTWVGLLFATLASGVQFSNLPKKDRDLASQIYVCCSFECLRLINWLSNSSIEVIQTLLLLGNVLSNAMNAGVAWSLLGLTTRLAQSLGLHRASDVAKPSQQDLVRAKTWWSVLWQDSMLSLSYDRAPSAAVVDCAFPSDPHPSKPGYTYSECMYRLCKIGLDIVRNRVANQSIDSRLGRCDTLRKSIEQMQSEAADHLRDIRKSTSIKDQSEHWMLYLHASFLISELCRPSISPTIAQFDKSRVLRRLCIEHLQNTVDAFLGLVNVSPVYLRAWSAVHRVLSAALLLGILGESLRNPRANDLLSRLVAVMSEPPAGSTDPPDLSAPIARSISALRKLNTPESRTPRPLDETSQQQQDTPNAFGDVFTPFDFDASNFFLPSPRSGFEDDSSPYALMDSIIWGPGGSNGTAMGTIAGPVNGNVATGSARTPP